MRSSWKHGVVRLECESTLFALVTVTSIVANLPEHFLGDYINQNMLISVLSLVVFIALLRYLRVLLLLCVFTLAAGANLPELIADRLGFDQTIMLGFLSTVLIIAIVSKIMNYVARETSRSETNHKEKTDTDQARRAVMTAISIGNFDRLKWLIRQNMAEINFIVDGTTPVMLAAEKGNAEIMQLLIFHGANVNVTNAEGKTAYEVALSLGYKQTAEIIRFALKNLMPDTLAGNQPAEPAQQHPTAEGYAGSHPQQA